jgi:UDP-N-acetylmuramyl pentapeptide phosphotransferase/UDP-N-acetylglucosamine-1-phosphate transferase
MAKGAGLKAERMNYITLFVVSLLVSVLIVMTKSWHGRWTLDPIAGIQKQHKVPTARIGGIAILAGLIAAYFLTQHSVQRIIGCLLIACAPAFIFGLLEDLTKKISVFVRLCATISSGVIASYISGVSMQDTGVVSFDWLLSFPLIAILFTGFAVGGVANAVNIIDGFNGLAVGAAAIMLSAIGLISLNVRDIDLATVCFLCVAIALGFGLVNWPKGRLFLGDGGAYLIGFVLAWMAIKLPMRSADINAWATLVVCTYPVLEVGFSVRRRLRRQRGHSGQPDNLHLHHLIHSRIVRHWFPKQSVLIQNGMTSPICWLITAMPAAWAIVFAKSTPMLALGFFGFVVAYAAVYARLSQFGWCFRARTLRPVGV